MLSNHEDVIDRLANWDLLDDVSAITQDDPRVLDIYKQFQTHFKNFHLHFDNIIRISEQFNRVIKDFMTESDRIGQVAEFIKNGAERQTTEIEKSMKLVKVFSDKVSTINEKSQDIISLAYDMEKTNRNVDSSFDQLVLNQEKNDKAIQNMFDVISQLIVKTHKIDEITEMMKRISSETFL
jgi:methyl-accepting chemotaxis protein